MGKCNKIGEMGCDRVSGFRIQDPNTQLIKIIYTDKIPNYDDLTE